MVCLKRGGGETPQSPSTLHMPPLPLHQILTQLPFNILHMGLVRSAVKCHAKLVLVRFPLHLSSVINSSAPISLLLQYQHSWIFTSFGVRPEHVSRTLGWKRDRVRSRLTAVSQCSEFLFPDPPMEGPRCNGFQLGPLGDGVMVLAVLYGPRIGSDWEESSLLRPCFGSGEIKQRLL